jgi:hypothetical protein
LADAPDLKGFGSRLDLLWVSPDGLRDPAIGAAVEAVVAGLSLVDGGEALELGRESYLQLVALSLRSRGTGDSN